MPHQAPSGLRQTAPQGPTGPTGPGKGTRGEGRPALLLISDAAALASQPLVPGAMIAHHAIPTGAALSKHDDIDDDDDDEDEEDEDGPR